jgi:hypothetical protein
MKADHTNIQCTKQQHFFRKKMALTDYLLSEVNY